MHSRDRRSVVVASLLLALTGGSAPAQTVGSDAQPEPNPLSGLDTPHEQSVPAPAGEPASRAGVQSAESQIAGVMFPPASLIRQVNVNLAGLNVLGDAANEPSIAINPRNPNQIVIGWRQFDTILNSFREAGVAHSSNGGLTWNNNGPLENGTFRSDPVLDFNAEGMIFYSSLKVVNNVFDTWVFRSVNGGASWGNAIFSFGGDKQWLAIDRTGGIGHGNIYQAWNLAGNRFSPAIFNRSINDGLTWSTPITIPGSPRFGQLAVGPDGELYIGGVTTTGIGFVVVRSNDARNPLVSVPTFPIVTQPNLGGNLQVATGPNPAGLLGPLNLTVDHSPARRGWVYVLASVTTSTLQPLAVHHARSVDGGVTWSSFARVNDDPVGNGAYHWFGTMSVSPSGRIDVVWLDTRADPLAQRSALYYSFSLDGGATWAANMQLTTDFDHGLGYPQQNKMGDYYDMISDDAGASLAFAATFNGEQDVYYLRIDFPPFASTARDCNANGLPDDTEIQLGLALDQNLNGAVDACEFGVCLIDTDLNGLVDFGDVLTVLANWTSGGPGAPGDANGDGIVTFDDIVTVLGAWGGTCP